MQPHRSDAQPKAAPVDTNDPNADRRTVVTRLRRLMGTAVNVQIAADHQQAPAAERAAHAALDWLAEVDARLSRFRAESELSQLNRSGGGWFNASELMFTAVECAVAAARTSGGLFDPTLLRQLEALGYDRDFSAVSGRNGHESDVPLPSSPPEKSATGPGGLWRALQLDGARRRIWLPEGAALDLGGIAKGWAADVALERFCATFPGALVNVGGDLRLRGGPQPGEPWSVGIRDPRHERQDTAEQHGQDAVYRATIAFSRGGLATSGAVRRWWWRDGERVHHLLDPRTGRPMPLWLGPPDGADGQLAPTTDAAEGALPAEENAEIATVTALAPTAARAEVATKVTLLRGYLAALRAVERAWDRWGAVTVDETNSAGETDETDETRADAGVALVIVLGNGELACSENLSAWLASWGTAGASLPALVGRSSL